MRQKLARIKVGNYEICIHESVTYIVNVGKIRTNLIAEVVLQEIAHESVGSPFRNTERLPESL